MNIHHHRKFIPPARALLQLTCLLVALCQGSGTAAAINAIHPAMDCQPAAGSPTEPTASTGALAGQAIAITQGGAVIEASDPGTGNIFWSIQGSALAANPAGDFAELAKTVSPAQRTTIRWCDSLCRPRDVFLFGGGYDPLFDLAAIPPQRSTGNAIYIVDASSGEPLWSAGAGIHHRLPLADMQHSIAAAVTVLDKDNDCYADTLFAIDIVGNLFRIELPYSSDPAEAAGGGERIADIGGGGQHFRQFFNAVDISVHTTADSTAFFTAAAASGNPNQAVDKRVQHYLFVLFVPFSAQVGAMGTNTPVTPDMLSVAGRQPVSPNGWYMPLSSPGEMAAADTTTINRWIILMTITPQWDPVTDTTSRFGRAYILDALTGESRLDPQALAELLANRQSSASQVSTKNIPRYIALGNIGAHATPATTVKVIADCGQHCEATGPLASLPDQQQSLLTCIGDACSASGIEAPLLPLYWRAN